MDSNSLTEIPDWKIKHICAGKQLQGHSLSTVFKHNSTDVIQAEHGLVITHLLLQGFCSFSAEHFPHHHIVQDLPAAPPAQLSETKLLDKYTAMKIKVLKETCL